MRGSALITYESATLVLLINRKADAIVHAETQFAAHPAHGAAGHGALIFQGLWDAVTTATGRELLEHLGKAHGVGVVADALNKVVKCLLPNKTLQRVKRYLRREASAAPSLHVPELAWFQHPFVQIRDGTLAQCITTSHHSSNVCRKVSNGRSQIRIRWPTVATHGLANCVHAPTTKHAERVHAPTNDSHPTLKQTFTRQNFARSTRSPYSVNARS